VIRTYWLLDTYIVMRESLHEIYLIHCVVERMQGVLLLGVKQAVYCSCKVLDVDTLQNLLVA
jgi:hypothetical protein